MNVSINVGGGLRMSKPDGASRLSQNSHLVNYALNGLKKCWPTELGRWSHSYHLDGRDSPNESLPPSDAFYHTNCSSWDVAARRDS
jgi:hypothetical protein